MRKGDTIQTNKNTLDIEGYTFRCVAIFEFEEIPNEAVVEIRCQYCY